MIFFNHNFKHLDDALERIQVMTERSELIKEQNDTPLRFTLCGSYISLELPK